MPSFAERHFRSRLFEGMSSLVNREDFPPGLLNPDIGRTDEVLLRSLDARPGL